MSLPPPCDTEIFKNGTPLAFLTGRSAEIESLIVTVRRKTKARIDWHYSGGIAQVLFLGPETSIPLVAQTIADLLPTYPEIHLQRGLTRRFRSGVDDPEDFA